MDRYNAKPIDLYRYALPLFIAGAIVFAYDWHWLGIGLGLLGLGMGLWTIVAGLIEQVVYLNDHPAVNIRVSPVEPELGDKWIKEPEAPQGLLNASLFRPPVTGSRLTQFVDGILQGKSLAETEWSPIKKGKLFSSIEIRELKAELRKHKLIKASNAKNHLMGDVLTAKGRRELHSYASPGVRQILESREHGYAGSPTLVRGGEEPTLE